MARILSFAMLVAAVGWVSGKNQRSGSTLCDLNKDGTVRTCLNYAMSLMKHELDDPLYLWPFDGKVHYDHKGDEYDFTNIHLTGVREFRYKLGISFTNGSDESNIQSSVLKDMEAKISLTWTNMKFVMDTGVTLRPQFSVLPNGSCVKARDTRDHLYFRTEIRFDSATLHNLACYLKVYDDATHYYPFEFDSCQTTESGVQLHVHKESLEASIKHIPLLQCGQEEANTTYMAHKAWMKSKRAVRLLLQHKMMRFIPGVFGTVATNMIGEGRNPAPNTAIKSCDLNTNGTVKRCLKYLIPLLKPKLDDRIDFSMENLTVQFNVGDVKFNFSDMYLTGVREFSYDSSVSFADRSDKHDSQPRVLKAMESRISLNWTSMKFVMNTSVTTCPNNQCGKTMHAQAEISLNSATFPLICYSGVLDSTIHGRYLEHYSCRKMALGVQLHVDEDSLQDSIKFHPAHLRPEKSTFGLVTAYHAWLKSKETVRLALQNKMMLFVSRVFRSLAGNMIGKRPNNATDYCDLNNKAPGKRCWTYAISLLRPTLDDLTDPMWSWNVSYENANYHFTNMHVTGVRDFSYMFQTSNEAIPTSQRLDKKSVLSLIVFNWNSMKLVLNTSVTRCPKKCGETLHAQAEISITTDSLVLECLLAVLNDTVYNPPLKNFSCSIQEAGIHLLFDGSLHDQINLHPSNQFEPEETESMKEAVFEVWQQAKEDVKVLLDEKITSFVRRVFEFATANLAGYTSKSQMHTSW